MSILDKLRIKDAIKSEPISHIVRGASTKDTIKSILDPGELLLKQSPEGSGWNPAVSRAEQKAKLKKDKKKRQLKKAQGLKAGGSTTTHRKRRAQRNKRATGMASGGICRGGGAATRGMKFGKNG